MSRRIFAFMCEGDTLSTGNPAGYGLPLNGTGRDDARGAKLEQPQSAS